jgi:hypothetical protein
MNLVKHIVPVVLYALSIGTAYASDLTVINQSSAASPAGVYAQAVRKSLDAKWYQSSNCKDAANKFQTTENAVMVYNSSVAFAAKNKKMENCQLDQIAKNKASVVLVSASRMLICSKPGQAKSLLTDKVSLGMASMYAVPKHQAQWNANGGNVTLVPYSGSKTVLTALLAGDIEWGWMGESLALKQGDKLSCQYSTDPASDNFLGKAVPSLTIADFAINVVVYTNAKDPIAVVYALKGDADFQNYLIKGKNATTFSVTDVSSVDAYVTTMFDTWAD